MQNAIGIWDVDLKTRLVRVGPERGSVGSLALPDGPLPVAALEGFVHNEDREALASAVLALLEGRSAALRHTFRIGSGDQWTWVEVTGRKSTDGHALAGIWADVTTAKAAETRKDEAVTRIHQFAAAASHDLIGPLRHIAMYGDMLLGDIGTGATDETRQMLHAITDKARMLQVLTKRLIAFSTDTAAPEFVSVPVDRVIANVRKRMEAELDEADAVVVTEPLPVVTGDPILIEKLFENLIRNALEWRSVRPLSVSIRGREKGRSAVIRVKDNGMGIDARYATRIFDAFWSLPRPGGAKGAGLGLAVCKTITNALGGQITLVASSADGSTFEITLPSGG